MVKHYALMSGGYDSLVASHIAMENGPADEVLHMDTGTGIPQNRQFIVDLCNEFGWDLRIKRATTSLQEFAIKYGFPEPANHSWIYRYLKERQLGAVATECNEKPHFWSGVRMDESERRMKFIVESGKVWDQGRWIWHSPIISFSKERVMQYMEDNDLPENPVVEDIHRSGECFCGAFFNRDEALIDLQANYPEHYEWLKSVEEEVKEERGNDKRSNWAWSGLSDLEEWALKNSNQMLCSDCVIDTHGTSKDVTW